MIQGITTLITTSPTAAVDPTDAVARAQPASAVGDAFGKALQAAQLPPPPPLPATAGLASVNPMLLHEIALSDRRRRDGEARHRGKTMLDALTELQLLTLGSGNTDATLDRIAGLLSSIPQADDPALASVVRGIAVRAAVEVSRRRPA